MVPSIYLMTEANPGKSQLGNRLKPVLKNHTPSQREREREREREKGRKEGREGSINREPFLGLYCVRRVGESFL